jgi:hypothetical protein
VLLDSVAAAGRLAAVGLLALAVQGCASEAVEPVSPPYLAIVTLFDAPPGPDVEAGLRYHVRDIIGLEPLDTVIRISPTDTVIIPVPPSTYRVVIEGLPERCSTRSGTQQDVVLLEEYNTGLARFIVNCQPTLGFAVSAYGPSVDSEFIFRLRGGEGAVDSAGVLRSGDSVFVSPLPPGDYSLTLGHVAPNCLAVSDGGAVQRFTVGATAGPFRTFNVSCSSPSQRPAVRAVRGSFRDGALGFVVTATDPDNDIATLLWDLTSCDATSLRGGVPVERRFALDRARVDTVTFLGATEIALSGEDAAIACVAVRVTDSLGNSSELVERRLQSSGQRPTATRFNSFVRSGVATRIELEANDADGDLVGTVVLRRVRDGYFGPPDGRDEFLLARSEGYLSTLIPDLPLGAPFPTQEDVNAVYVYLIDAAGNFTRYIDTDVFR